MYFKITFTCGNDYPDYIISSEGKFEPNNPYKIWNPDIRENYIFDFNIIKHNIDKELCIKWVNLRSWGEFVFNSFLVNEYDITDVRYEDFFFCEKCNANTGKGFHSTEYKCKGKSYIKVLLVPEEVFFCLNPINDPTIFYIDETKINQKYYIGKNINYIINNDTEKIYIDKIFNINGEENLEFNLETVSLVITNITNKKGNIFNGDEELNINSFFNPKKNILFIKE